MSKSEVCGHYPLHLINARLDAVSSLLYINFMIDVNDFTDEEAEREHPEANLYFNRYFDLLTKRT